MDLLVLEIRSICPDLPMLTVAQRLSPDPSQVKINIFSSETFGLCLNSDIQPFETRFLKVNSITFRLRYEYISLFCLTTINHI